MLFLPGSLVVGSVKPAEGSPCSGDQFTRHCPPFRNPINLCPRRGSGNFLLRSKRKARGLTSEGNEGCPVLYDPVCAGPVFGVDKLYTFKNLCYLDSYNCKRLRKYEVKYQGLCYPK